MSILLFRQLQHVFRKGLQFKEQDPTTCKSIFLKITFVLPPKSEIDKSLKIIISILLAFAYMVAIVFNMPL